MILIERITAKIRKITFPFLREILNSHQAKLVKLARGDTSQEEILGGSGPENLFFDNLRLDNTETTLQADLARRRALENARGHLIVPDKRAVDDANKRVFDEAFMADGDRGASGGPPGEFPGELPGANRVNQVDPQVGLLPPPRVPPVGNPAAPPPGADAGGARAREQDVPGQAAGKPRLHPHDYLMNVIKNLAHNAQYAERAREHDARTMNQMAVNMQNIGRNLIEGIQQMQQQQQQQY